MPLRDAMTTVFFAYVDLKALQLCLDRGNLLRVAGLPERSLTAGGFLPASTCPFGRGAAWCRPSVLYEYRV